MNLQHGKQNRRLESFLLILFLSNMSSHQVSNISYRCLPSKQQYLSMDEVFYGYRQITDLLLN